MEDEAENVCTIFPSGPPEICSNLCKSQQDCQKSGESAKSISAAAAPRTKNRKLQPKGNLMLWTVFVILLILWLLGGFIVPFGGNLIHILLVIAVVVLIVNLISGKRTL
jgi:cytosine/uracil/thiamine/allantoin permease